MIPNLSLSRNNIFLLFFYSAILLLASTSCITHKQLRYLDLEGSSISQDSLYEIAYEDYYLQPGDLIDIKVKSMDPESVMIFNNTDDRNRNNVSEASVYLSSYHIGQDGFLDLPIIGSFKASGLSLPQLNDTLLVKLKKYFKVISVYSNLTSFRVTVLGEVESPNSFTMFYEENNILNCIAKSGGFTDYADKTNIQLIRKSKGNQIVFSLDLSSMSIINSNHFFLHPNDVIYVKPLKTKPFRMNSTSISLFISSLTLIILLINSTNRR